ncbi:MerR family transcriptional regulator [Endozoicomonas sp. GU-1]|uniref:MerR family transcriptional regulator n=1 Tax=Endozoicomonas sp. GU-1 TaxID=3009078 RepID=UPI0022B4859D|nr:MerR family transcriptional regulator [Endozoicomonas sp. GU-1]WBA81858.1 MerR family transcriptional regulator [Endozoicomonas sp. GU-1]WBA84812.1 MerR family transcriptional regulator [Endozoicomonas sp. GU-1]
MYRISELAAQVGLSRAALIYYEKIGLIKGKRQANGYRRYSDRDVQQLHMIQLLQAGGLTLKECQACLNAKIERQLLSNRLHRLDEEIARKQKSRQLLAAMLGEGELTAWHEQVDKIAPDVHLDWLIKQGFDEKNALRLKWLSKDMNSHQKYMADFTRVFDILDRWGPGSEEETLKALAQVPISVQTILELGCGKGIATAVLAQNSSAQITAVDNDEPALIRLMERAREAGVEERITTHCGSMTDLPFEPESFDLIWAEASAYIMGVPHAMQQWQNLLRKNGVLVISDLVWKTHTPDKEVRSFWDKEYPGLVTTEERLQQAEAAGYRVIDSFALSKQAWKAYYEPLEIRVNDLKAEMADSAALRDIQAELEIYHNYLGQFGYQVFVLQRSEKL